MKQWYFTYHVHTNNFSIFETDEYVGNYGYATKKEAIDAAKKFALNRIKLESISIKQDSFILQQKADSLNKLLNAMLELDND